MKLLLITKEDCVNCIEARKMVYQELPTLLPGLEIEELDAYRDMEKYMDYYGDIHMPGFVMFTDSSRIMFRIAGLPNGKYIRYQVELYENRANGLLSDEELEKVVGGMIESSVIPCDSTKSTCIM